MLQVESNKTKDQLKTLSIGDQGLAANIVLVQDFHRGWTIQSLKLHKQFLWFYTEAVQ